MQTHLPTLPSSSQRLVKGVFADYTLAGQLCRCSECQKEHKPLAAQLKAAESAHVDAAQLTELRAKVKATSYNFMTYDPRVTKFYFDRHPWVAMKLEAFITHKAAISTELLWMLTHSAPKGQTLGGLESMLTTFRALAANTSLITFYSCQRAWARQQQQRLSFDDDDEREILHLKVGLSSVSDSYLHSILEDWYFEGHEQYFRWPRPLVLRVPHSPSSIACPHLLPLPHRLSPWPSLRQVPASVVRAALPARRLPERSPLQVLVACTARR